MSSNHTPLHADSSFREVSTRLHLHCHKLYEKFAQWPNETVTHFFSVASRSGLKFRPSRHLAAMIYTSNYPVMLGFCGTTAARSYELNFEIIKHDALFARHQHRSSFLYIKNCTTHCRHFVSMQSDNTIGDVNYYF